MIRRFGAILGAALGIVCLASRGAAQTFEIVHEFRHSGDNPRSPVLAASDGNLYVTTYGGGDFRKGSVQKLTPDGIGGYTCSLLHSFDGVNGAFPNGGLVEGSDGMLYGLAQFGGVEDKGVAYRISTDGGFTVLHYFSGPDGSSPMGELVLASDGKFYGTSLLGGLNDFGVVFRMSSSGDTAAYYAFTSLTGGHPQTGLLIGPDGLLYGTTTQGGPEGFGVLFRMDLQGSFTVLHEFAFVDELTPSGRLATLGGLIYGTTAEATQSGRIFRMDLLGSFTYVHVFSGSDGSRPVGLTAGADGFLYGVTEQGGSTFFAGIVYRADANGNVTTLHEFAPADGVVPAVPPVRVGTDLFGTTTLNGPNFDGTVYRLANDGTYTVLCPFGTGEGMNPVDVLLEAEDGNLYATTVWGGANFGGTIFRLSKGGAFTTLHSFAGLEGARPGSGLVQAPDGNLYGTTTSGGFDNIGTYFRMDLTGNYTLLHTMVFFDEGGSPSGRLTLGSDQNLYGPVDDYGSCGNGTIYRFGTDGTLTPIHAFCGDSGTNPFDRLFPGLDGKLYGVARGDAFRLSPDGAFESLRFFGSFPAPGPAAGITPGPDGNLYGAMTADFTNRGALFRLRPDGHLLLLHVFPFPPGPSGTLQKSALLLASDGNFYGATRTDSSDEHGEVFRINRYGDFATVHTFADNDGRSPTGLIQASDGRLYGTTIGGGPDGVGVAYRIDLGVQAATLQPASGPATDANAFALDGHGFQDGASVSFGGAPAADVVVTDGGHLSGTTPILFPGTLNDVVVTNPDISTGTLVHGWLADFLDVPLNDPFHPAVETLTRFHIAAGYGTGFFGRDDPVTRAQIAPLLLKGSIGPGFAATYCDPARFADVSCDGPFGAWITELSGRQITAGCQADPPAYCPDAIVTRAQIAVFLLKALHGADFQPGHCMGLFEDVACPDGFAVDWIEELYQEDITAGCSASPLLYCPEQPVSRGELAVLEVLAFGL